MMNFELLIFQQINVMCCGMNIATQNAADVHYSNGRFYMRRNVRFHCPNCQASFTILWKTDQFCCSNCHQDFAVVALGRGKRGWIYITDGQTLGGAWTRAFAEEIHSFEKSGLVRGHRKDALTAEVRSLGAARTRRERRRSRPQRNIPAAVKFLGVFLLVGAVLLFPFVAKGSPGEMEFTKAEKSITSLETDIPTVSPLPSQISTTPSHTNTPTPTLTPSPTASPLPQRLVAATAWRATLDQATFYSHATQTKSVANYSATQTSLPYTVTAAATERAATATQKAFAATEKANSRP